MARGWGGRSSGGRAWRAGCERLWGAIGLTCGVGGRYEKEFEAVQDVFELQVCFSVLTTLSPIPSRPRLARVNPVS